MKKLSITLISTLLFLASCAPDNNEEEEVVQENEITEQQTSIVPSYQLTDETYRIILPYQTSEARGVITNQMGNRVDIDELEEGLMRHSKEVFDPSELYFQEGQYLSSDQVFNWIDELNPQIDEDELEGLEKEEKVEVYEENPRYLTHILEQNYLKRNEDSTVDLAGVSIGIALKSIYRFQTEIGGPYYYEEIPMSQMIEKGQEVAQTIVSEMREMEDFPDVPIMIALFREEEQNSPVPGSFVSKTLVPAGDNSIDGWETINEENVLFPSNRASSEFPEDHEVISSFGTEISQFFPNYVGYVGKGFYVNDELQRLTLEIPLEFYGKGEVIGFTQYTYGLVQDMFANNYDLEINITSSHGTESLINREAGEETPTVHIYD
ncbi:CamS family sex pheromone protein [Oceanobacillus salinisoli]|uniref:CamS family sex pheromone protein n=1 Tax=Oceanobacillus salinisoli TaxID=2678611 RepID=UPI0012E21AAC|nr:CamS family sex pheromone protein [Oceanobacillus salinisoli]